jgi:TM2 domain-containing membrane protein YozV
MKELITFFFFIHALLFLTSGAKGAISYAPEVFFTDIKPNQSTHHFFSQEIELPFTLKQCLIEKLKVCKTENKRLTAFTLTVLLGPFGVHRLYLGTKPIIPIAYTLTLGGGLGIIPLIDAGIILFTKDLSELENNPKFFMWAE